MRPANGPRTPLAISYEIQSIVYTSDDMVTLCMRLGALCRRLEQKPEKPERPRKRRA